MILFKLNKLNLLKFNPNMIQKAFMSQKTNDQPPLFNVLSSIQQGYYFCTTKKLFGSKQTHTSMQQKKQQQQTIQKVFGESQKQIIKSKPKWATKLTQNSQQNAKQKAFKFQQKPNKFLKFTQQKKTNDHQQKYLQQPPKSKHSSSYNLHQCELILYRFKDIAKQSKNVRSLILSFHEYLQKLENHNVQQTELKQKYKPIMYSAVVRTFARIVRRQQNPQKGLMLEFLGTNYENINSLKLQMLRTLQLSDFISFFFLSELIGKYRFVTKQKVAVVEKYLKALHERYRDNVQMNWRDNQKQLVSEQKMQKRYLSEIILASRCAQLFKSDSYDRYLDLILQHIKQKQLVGYKIVSIVKFILRNDSSDTFLQNPDQQFNSQTEGFNFREKQFQLLEKIIERVQTSNVLEQMDEISLREFYANIISINLNIFEKSQQKDIIIGQKLQNTIKKTEQNILKRMEKFTAQQIYLIAFHSLKFIKKFTNMSNYPKVFIEIYTKIFDNINQKGETSLNPLFVLMMCSNLNYDVFSLENKQMANKRKAEAKNMQRWVLKFRLMVENYLIGQSPLQNLSYCSEYLTKLIRNLQALSQQSQQSKKLYTTLINALINRSLIVPYDNESMLIENYYLTDTVLNQKINLQNQELSQAVYLTLFRMKNLRSQKDKKLGLFNHVFQSLQSIISQQKKSQIQQKYKKQIQGVGEIRKNKQLYVRLLAKLCCVMKRSELIDEIFIESLQQILGFDSNRKNKQIQQKPSQQFSQLDFKSVDLLITSDFKCRQKLYSLMSNFITIILQQKPDLIVDDLFSQLMSQIAEHVTKKNKFVQILSKSQQLTKIYVDVLVTRETSLMMLNQYYKSKYSSMTPIKYCINIGIYLIKSKEFHMQQNKDQIGKEIYSEKTNLKLQNFRRSINKNYPQLYNELIF